MENQKIVIPEGMELVKEDDNTYVIKKVEPPIKQHVLLFRPLHGDWGALINGHWVMKILSHSKQVVGYMGTELSRHFSPIYLDRSHGTWYTEDGTEVSGYLFFKPKYQ